MVFHNQYIVVKDPLDDVCIETCRGALNHHNGYNHPQNDDYTSCTKDDHEYLMLTLHLSSWLQTDGHE